MGKGGNKDQARRLEQLTSLGFSKTKAAQALKDAGNNHQLALQILTRQEDQRLAKEASASVKPVSVLTDPGSRQVANAAEDEEDEEDEVPGPLPASQRRHPCIVQYKKCMYGQFCKLKDYPGDTCINYFNGTCIYGEACRRRHTIDGVDIRAAERPRFSDTFTRDDGTRYRVLETSHGTVQRAELVDTAESVDHVLQGTVIAGPEASDFNLIRGAEPTHTDPIDRTRTVQNGTARTGVSGPQPFLEKARQAPAPASAGRSVQDHLAHAVAAPPAVAPVRRKHPCVAQCGGCKYGDACQHAERDADVCVFFLNGRCRFTAEQCKYRHETEDEYTAKLLHQRELRALQAEQLRSSPSALSKNAKNRLQGMGSTGQGQPRMQRVSSSASNDNSTAMLEDEAAYTGSPPPEWPCGPAAAAGAAGRPVPAKASEFFPASPGATEALGGWTVSAAESDETAANTAMAAAYSPLPDSELQTFLGLLEAFPAEEPAFVLQALRSTHGDPVAVADLLGRVEEAAPEDIDAVLAKAVAEEEQAEAAAAQRNHEMLAKTESLLTLGFLFPALALGSVEAVFHQCADNFEEAYEILLCSQENITRRDYGNVWRGNVNPSEQLKLEKLCGMFPETHPDIVRSTFGASEKSSLATIAALNELTSELLTLRTRVQMGAAAIRWRPGTSHDGRQSSAVVRSTGRVEPSVTEDEVRTMYKEAQAELREHGDWRRVRERAYMVNSCRIRVLSQASAAFLRGDGKLAKALSKEGKDLGAEYERLNRLAMLALETERLQTEPATTLDLHGFHTDEAVEVLTRRVDLCRRKRIPRLTVIVGEGHHSRRGKSTVYPTVREHLRSDSYMLSTVRVVSVQPGYLELRVLLA